MTYIYPVERSAQITMISMGVVFAILPTVGVVLRILARRISHRTVDISDYLIIAACVVAVAYQGVVIAAVLVGGMGFHTAELIAMGGNESFVLLMKIVMVVQVLWSVSLGLTKGSILLLYSKVFSLPSFIVASKITAGLVLLWALVLIVGPFVICQPLAYNWDMSIPGGHCGDSKVMWIITGIFNIVTDMMVLLLPMPYIYSLQLTMYKRLALMGTFGLGLAVCIVSSVRLKALVSLDLTDFAFTGPTSVILSALEPCLLITAACVPLLRPLLGGHYSPTGTKKVNPSVPYHSKGSAGPGAPFKKIHSGEDASKRQLRPELVSYEVQITSKDDAGLAGNTVVGEHDVELRTISVLTDWRVDSEEDRVKPKSKEGADLV